MFSYQTYLNSKEWYKKRRSASGFSRVCFVCGDKKRLHLHHLHYRNIGNEDIENDVVFLCAFHHKEVHELSKREKLSIVDATEKIKKDNFVWTKRDSWNYLMRDIVPLYKD